MPSCLRFDQKKNNCVKCDKNDNKICAELYNSYKKICDIKKCKFDIGTGSLKECSELYRTSKLTYLKFYLCLIKREKHRLFCIDKKCIDKGHEHQLELLINNCRNVLKKLIKHLNTKNEEYQRLRNEIIEWMKKQPFESIF
jgi:hypothetical protein